jgi:hypothetical protein
MPCVEDFPEICESFKLGDCRWWRSVSKRISDGLKYLDKNSVFRSGHGYLPVGVAEFYCYCVRGDNLALDVFLASLKQQYYESSAGLI